MNDLLPFGVDPNVFLRAIQRIEIKSQYGPDVVLDDPFNPDQKPNPFLKKLKPEVTLFLGNKQVQLAPYGRPGKTQWPLIRNAAIVGAAAGGLALAWYLFQKVSK